MFLPPEIKSLSIGQYERRSSDDSDHQTASIEQQHNVLSDLAKREGLKIKVVHSESKSAKQPGRPVFTQLIEKVENGEIQAILCWDLSRLSRNPVDSGRLGWALQNGVLKAIVTPQKIYLPEDNVLLLNVEFGMANQYLRDLAKNVKRGLQNKVNNGWRPGMAPEGYNNDRNDPKGERKVIPDPERFPILRKAWELLLTGSYTVPQVLDILNNKWGYRMRSHKKIGNTPMGRANMYRIFTNPFYFGEFEYGGQWYIGKHQPMITKDEYDKVQAILGRKGKQRPKTREFAYTGMIHCGECGAMITAEEKVNRFGSRYVYYHCTKRKDPNCTQGYIELRELERQIDDSLAKVEIPEAFVEWAVKYLNELHDKESVDQVSVNHSLESAYNDCVQRINNLVKLKISSQNTDGSVLSDADFSEQMSFLKKEKTQLEEQRKQFAGRVDKWVDLSIKTFDFACHARYQFQQAALQDKRQILQTIGSNFLLKDKTLYIDLPKPFQVIEGGKIEVDKITDRFEPEEMTVLTPQMARLFDENLLLRKGRDLNPR